ncbi:invertase inhibitor [Dorcoceras hygrometricum]|uniref:Invertase inhibitor n=1 Tax=Dorcoceras hygrometricum TaxID=472368 RepID=A0A2Z6ZZC7_9LAMI|nr:invertase inhibitor [Dorcoceras hygrometricum]
MVSPLNYRIIFLLVNGFLLPMAHATSTILEEVCHKVVDIDFCLNVFGSDPATRTASLPQLGQLAIAKATDKASTTRTDIKARSFFATDPKIRDLLNQCVHEYDDALVLIRMAAVDLKKARYAFVYQHASGAAREVFACEQGFIDKSVPSPLTRANLQLRDYCNIIEVIANFSDHEKTK